MPKPIPKEDDVKTWHLAIATTVATFVLLLVGGAVNPSGSSLACPDWPTCYGTLVPEMTGGVLFEHSHRLVATGVGLLTWILALALWFTRREDAKLRFLGLLAAVLVLVQGILGGVTVLLRLPTLVSTAHLALALGFFSLLIYLSFRSKPVPHTPPVEGDLARAARRAFIVGAVVVYGQILLGALLRHTGSGHSCTDIPLCHGVLWPALGAERLHMAHRAAGFLVLAVVVVTSLQVLRRVRTPGLVRAMAWAGPVLILVQVAVGVWTVLSSIAWVPAMIHLGVAAAILATQLIGWFGLVRFPAPQVIGAQRSEHHPVPATDLGEGIAT